MIVNKKEAVPKAIQHRGTEEQSYTEYMLCVTQKLRYSVLKFSTFGVAS